jgi:hypothetical protein
MEGDVNMSWILYVTCLEEPEAFWCVLWPPGRPRLWAEVRWQIDQVDKPELVRPGAWLMADDRLRRIRTFGGIPPLSAWRLRRLRRIADERQLLIAARRGA